MLKIKPRLTYSGLTVVLSNPSRFDTVSLLSGAGGSLFNDYCLRPENNSMQVEVRLADDTSTLLPGTKCVLLCGQYAMHKWLPMTKNNSIGEMRGSAFTMPHLGCVAIPTFFPQDAADLKAYEQQLNVNSKEYQPDASEYDSDDDEGESKKHGKTARRNYAFWLRADVAKAKVIIRNGGKIPAVPQPAYHIYPEQDEVVNILQRTKGKFMYFDIETDYADQNLQCFGFSFDGANVYSVPILNHNYHPAYPAYHRIMRALAIAVRDNTVVAHNGAAFDFFVLASKYRIPIRDAYDTMLAMHRCYPDIEKSLGHCTSLWTWEKFHKDEDSEGYLTYDQMMGRLKYCAKDVFTMFLIHQAIVEHARTIPGLVDSIACAMRAIRPYLVTTIQGIKYDSAKVSAITNENDRLMNQYMRCIKLLVGEATINSIGGKKSSFAGSNKQCCEYFHDILGYPVVARSKKTQKPSLTKQAMFKLALKHANPVIQFTLAYREVAKSYGTLQFLPWKDNNNKVINPRTYEASQNNQEYNSAPKTCEKSERGNEEVLV